MSVNNDIGLIMLIIVLIALYLFYATCNFYEIWVVLLSHFIFFNIYLIWCVAGSFAIIPRCTSFLILDWPECTASLHPRPIFCSHDVSVGSFFVAVERNRPQLPHPAPSRERQTVPTKPPSAHADALPCYGSCLTSSYQASISFRRYISCTLIYALI